MIFEGIKLMIVGMTTVMLFLMLMVLFINIVAKLTKSATARELKVIAEEKNLQALKRKQAKEAVSQDFDEDIAVISAAVAAYEAERFAKA
jgi:oxaloacetate decarboxylase gamma subunit